MEKIEKILHSQNSKESSSLESSRWETDMLTNPLASLGIYTGVECLQVFNQVMAFSAFAVVVFLFCALEQRVPFFSTKLKIADAKNGKNIRKNT